MPISPAQFPLIIDAVAQAIADNAASITELDQTIGDGDHVFNLQRGIEALQAKKAEIAILDWSAAWQVIGMTVMSAVGGASGSLYATLFISLAKHTRDQPADVTHFVQAFQQAVEAVKQRGKADVGEKTLLDVLVPVAISLHQSAEAGKALADLLDEVCCAADAGVESTRDMLATKGRASFLGERSKGHIDAGAKTAQLMLEAIASVLRGG
ncbi:MAG: dihydroxyacetone kinase subunit L [Methylomonas sp.]|nr:dihydroxyacetone kinase subunit L [Methylomonas sp.]PPD20785.1 MAG: dihydroxyacetone kinase subunit L [Methylomonas sp.]PPD27292.1 MAG: dihydroxyacetone kinase subunit L [Methylomonas sp.]PPD39263.1 MAG: dihydroxyacetone kinase subunit L [Methylomonas sp.]PPD40739.1 MAG: dihydroxyacetone kinase subunit L [Methylomonas sp.]